MEVLQPTLDRCSEPGYVTNKEKIRYTKKDIRAALAMNNAQKNGVSSSPIQTKKDINLRVSNKRKNVKGVSPMSVPSENALSSSFNTGSTSRTTPLMAMASASSTGVVYESPYCKFSQPLEPIKQNRAFGSDIDLPEISSSASVKNTSFRGPVNPKLRSMSYNAGQRTRTHEDGDFSVNPEPVPFQPQNFIMTINNVTTPVNDRSSTSLKKVPLPKRHLDSFGGYEYTMGAKRGLILHTDRYQWDGPRIYEGMSQRDRLRAEIEYMERLRGVKRRREMLPHRAQLDLLMGGKKVEFVERFDIQKEIQKLKSLVMPTNARDLFHGRGFKLPEEHCSIKPRKPPILDYDSDEDITSAPASLQRHYKGQIDPDTGVGKAKYGGSSRRNYDNHLPRINTRSSMLGLGSSAPILLSKEKRTVDQIKARISIPADDPHRGKKALSIKVHDMMGEADRFSEEGHWTPIISHNRQGASAVYLKRSRTNVQSKYDSRMQRSMTSYPQDKTLKVTIGNESVKRVDLTSSHPSAKSVPARQTKPAPEPDTDPPNTELGSEIRIMNPDMDEDLGIVDDDTLDRNTLISHVSKTASPVKSVTPNPLKGSELPDMISETERNELKEKFMRLDTDSDGHLMYSQVQTQLPKQLSSQQERFLKQVYDITSSSTFFGVDEFMTMSSLTKTVTNLNEAAVDSFQTLDFADLHDKISNYIQMFQIQDRGGRGKISLEALQQVLSQALEIDLNSDAPLWGNILDIVSPSEEIQITKIEFLAHIPYFMSLKKT